MTLEDLEYGRTKFEWLILRKSFGKTYYGTRGRFSDWVPEEREMRERGPRLTRGPYNKWGSRTFIILEIKIEHRED